MVWSPPRGWGYALWRLAAGALATVRLPPRQILTTLHALAIMALVEVLVRLMRADRLASLLGLRVDLSATRPGSARLPLRELPWRARLQVRCTNRVADAWPFSPGPCLRRSLVLGHLLRRLSPALRFGLIGSGHDLHAHAWLEIDGQPFEDVAGFNTFAQMSPGTSG